MGGEAIKAYQYFRHLLDHGFDAVLLTHERNRAGLIGEFPAERLIFVPETRLQALLWSSVVFRPLVAVYFHLAAARVVARFDPDRTILHYLCPISPVMPRFAPSGYRVVIGPLSGNIYHPPPFARRASLVSRMESVLHRPVQRLLGFLLGDKKRADHLLVSGAERTRMSLEWAGCDRGRMTDVADSGVSTRIAATARAVQEGRNPRFVAAGRLIELKGFDLAIAAVSRSRPDVTLTIFGEGPYRPHLEGLVARLGLADRVFLPGWIANDDLPAAMQQFRGFVFPTLREANGIAMQEAMMLGVPVIALRWGGPAMLADDTSAILIEPRDEETVVASLAEAMDRLADDADHAEALSVAARQRAEADFDWGVVAASWAVAYERVAPGEVVPGKASPLQGLTVVATGE